MKIVTVLGARPQFIKASVVSAEIARRSTLEETVIHTGQHFDANMSSIFFTELGMADPKYHLGIHGGHHGGMTARMLDGIEQILLKEKPDALLVYGDTNSTLAGTLAAVKLHIPVAHVEAGLRSFNMRMPEEINRILTDRVATWLFAPTTIAVAHLRREGLDEESIHQVGDVMYDAALHHGDRADKSGKSDVAGVALPSGGYVLVTAHRAENTDDPSRLRTILNAVMHVGRQMPVLWPLHPRTRGMLHGADLLALAANQVHVVDPLGYLDMVSAERRAAVIATDSGGVQKEAFFHGVPCVTLRDETEWVELVNAGWNRLVPPTDAEQVANAILVACGTRGVPVEPYGDGRAAQKIVNCLA
ncbi:MAG TPA: UDP-N-acetylglucosamine 2-epimerase (non-hydrolyzing) [Rhodanobacter sp.]|nr:UDP-N-acetylglucosamine 2-epimerase (non-hydrolyzing) [Rhodanobacter sp.]